MIELAPFEAIRTLADGAVERAFFWQESGVLAWLHERDAETVQVFYQGQPIKHEKLVAAFRAFDPGAVGYDERDVHTLAGR